MVDWGKWQAGWFRQAVGLLIMLGLYLTLEGYRSFEGDQAYRLPLLLHQLDPHLYQADPFVRAFDVFNPHSGYLWLLGLLARPFGLATALFLSFCATFLLTGWGISRLANSVWPGQGLAVGATAYGLVLLTKAGNIGTNHLFEPHLLDRLMALALGWVAIGSLVEQSKWSPMFVAGCVAAMNLIHPSLGLQLGLLCGSSWLVFGVFASRLGASRRQSIAGTLAVGLALVPAIWVLPARSRVLFDGMDSDQFFVLAAQVQSPQHMLPRLWRFPQWLAWFAYLALGAWGICLNCRWSYRAQTSDSGDEESTTTLPRRRVLVMLGLLLIGLLASGIAIELGSVRVTLFQPFRMATLVRGLCLVFAAGPVLRLWQSGTFEGRLRACLVAVGLSSDWLLVWVVGLELSATLVELRSQSTGPLPNLAVAAAASVWLSRHDPEQGQYALMLGVLLAVVTHVISRKFTSFELTPRRQLRLLAIAWAFPVIAIIWESGLIPASVPPPAALVSHFRSAEIPEDDLERLAVWCRANTTPGAVFMGPPGPKGFRLWSRRSLAFNRAGSPYHAAGLADWAARFQAHVGHQGSLQEFAQSYLTNRQDLERGFDRLDANALVELARSQGADHLLTSSKADVHDPRLIPLHSEGRYAVYRLESSQ